MGLKRQIQLQEWIKIDKIKMQKWLEPIYMTSNVDADQTPHSVASDPGQHCLQVFLSQHLGSLQY